MCHELGHGWDFFGRGICQVSKKYLWFIYEQIIMSILDLIFSIIFIVISVNWLINIDKLSHRNSWVDKYLNYESKRRFFKFLSVTLMICGLIIVISRIILIVVYNEPIGIF